MAGAAGCPDALLLEFTEAVRQYRIVSAVADTLVSPCDDATYAGVIAMGGRWRDKVVQRMLAGNVFFALCDALRTVRTKLDDVSEEQLSAPASAAKEIWTRPDAVSAVRRYKALWLSLLEATTLLLGTPDGDLRALLEEDPLVGRDTSVTSRTPRVVPPATGTGPSSASLLAGWLETSRILGVVCMGLVPPLVSAASSSYDINQFFPTTAAESGTGGVVAASDSRGGASVAAAVSRALSVSTGSATGVASRGRSARSAAAKNSFAFVADALIDVRTSAATLLHRIVGHETNTAGRLFFLRVAGGFPQVWDYVARCLTTWSPYTSPSGSPPMFLAEISSAVQIALEMCERLLRQAPPQAAFGPVAPFDPVLPAATTEVIEQAVRLAEGFLQRGGPMIQAWLIRVSAASDHPLGSVGKVQSPICDRLTKGRRTASPSAVRSAGGRVMLPPAVGSAAAPPAPLPYTTPAASTVSFEAVYAVLAAVAGQQAVARWCPSWTWFNSAVLGAVALDVQRQAASLPPAFLVREATAATPKPTTTTAVAPPGGAEGPTTALALVGADETGGRGSCRWAPRPSLLVSSPGRRPPLAMVAGDASPVPVKPDKHHDDDGGQEDDGGLPPLGASPAPSNRGSCCWLSPFRQSGRLLHTLVGGGGGEADAAPTMSSASASFPRIRYTHVVPLARYVQATLRTLSWLQSTTAAPPSKIAGPSAAPWLARAVAPLTAFEAVKAVVCALGLLPALEAILEAERRPAFRRYRSTLLGGCLTSVVKQLRELVVADQPPGTPQRSVGRLSTAF